MQGTPKGTFSEIIEEWDGIEQVDTKLRAHRVLWGGVHIRKNKTRRNYTDEFKYEAVKPVNEQWHKITETARNLGIHESVFRRWIKERSPETSRSSTGMVKFQAELKRVKTRPKELSWFIFRCFTTASVFILTWATWVKWNGKKGFYKKLLKKMSTFIWPLHFIMPSCFSTVPYSSHSASST